MLGFLGFYYHATSVVHSIAFKVPVKVLPPPLDHRYARLVEDSRRCCCIYWLVARSRCASRSTSHRNFVSHWHGTATSLLLDLGLPAGLSAEDRLMRKEGASNYYSREGFKIHTSFAVFVGYGMQAIWLNDRSGHHFLPSYLYIQVINDDFHIPPPSAIIRIL